MHSQAVSWALQADPIQAAVHRLCSVQILRFMLCAVAIVILL